MHRLDGYINDIGPRIDAICKYAPSQEEASLQESLASYGWILLDSWICWRTLRYLLREIDIDESVDEKWFQTPSSYNASQMKAIWKFSDEAADYIEEQSGKKLRNLIDNIVQKKRNSSAHFSKKNSVSGSDVQLIKKVFDTLSVVFTAYECGAFLKEIEVKLLKRGYTQFAVCKYDDEVCDLDKLKDCFECFEQYKKFTVKFSKNEENQKSVVFQEDGCWMMNEKNELESIANKDHPQYNFFGNKGYYRDVELFLTSCGLDN